MVAVKDAKNIARQALDVDRVRRTPSQFPPVQFMLASITSATLIANYRYEYTWAEAWMTNTNAGNKVPGLAGVAYSVSELTNTATPTTYSYGVTSASLPVGFIPVRIPTGTYVMLVPHRKSNGELTWLIINTQALDGIC